MIRQTRGIVPGTLEQPEGDAVVFRYLEDELGEQGKEARAGLVTAPYSPDGRPEFINGQMVMYPTGQRRQRLAVRDATVGQIPPDEVPTGDETRAEAGTKPDPARPLWPLLAAAALFL